MGYEALAIPHNANASNGLMYDWIRLDGRPIDEAYAEMRAANEPLSEISQNKGTSETHPILSPNDEFANFEIYDYLQQASKQPVKSKPPGSYMRDAWGRGLVLQSKVGVNPYKYGTVGASDLHGGLSVSAEADYGGNWGSANLGKGRPDVEQAKQILGYTENPMSGVGAIATSSGALTGAWAESNTRESLYDAFRRKETFATSGTHLKLRFFGGWTYDVALVDASSPSDRVTNPRRHAANYPRARLVLSHLVYPPWEALSDCEGAKIKKTVPALRHPLDSESRLRTANLLEATDFGRRSNISGGIAMVRSDSKC